MRATMWGLALAGAIVAGAAQTGAAASFDATLTGEGVDKSSVFPVTEDHVVVLTVSVYDALKADDPASPFTGAHGPCFGRIDIDAGKATGDGYCTFDTEDGRAVIRWTVDSATPDGVTKGEWQIHAGSGQWVGATGSGGFEQKVDPNTHRLVSHVTGRIERK